MKIILNFLGFCIWMILTVILVISVIGIMVFLPENINGDSHWFLLGKTLLKNFS
jgi:hypothetical protein